MRKILVVGVAYKKNIEDIRESPALRLMELLEERGAHVDYYDPHVPVIPDTRHYRGRTAAQVKHGAIFCATTRS